MQKVTVSILHYNSKKDTIDCLNSLLNLEMDEFEISVFVLDNGSKEKLILDSDKYKKINLKLDRLEQNLGFTGGHNYIYKETKNNDSQYFLLLNNDCLLKKDSIKHLIKAVSGENIAGVVPKIYFTKGREYHKDRYKEGDLGNVIWYAGGEIDWGNVVSKHIGLDEVDNGQYDKVASITFATGACFLLKKDVIDKVGLFDDRYFLYYEDADLSTKIIQKGYELLYVPNAIVWHSNAASSGSGSHLHDYYLTRNKLIFGMKYANVKVKALLLKEAARIGVNGRAWQKRGVYDYFFHRYGKGSYGE